MIQAVYLAQFLVQVASLILYASSPRTGLTFPCAVLSILATAIFMLGSHMEHRRSIRPSTVLVLYPVVTILFEIVHIRTLWSIEDLQRVAITTSVMLGPKVALSILESWLKVSLVLPECVSRNPEQLEGPLGRALFSWLNQIFVLGFGTKLAVQDLFSMEPSMCPPIEKNRLALLWAQSRSLPFVPGSEPLLNKQLYRRYKDEPQHIGLSNH